ADYATALLEGGLNPWSKESFGLYACAMVSFLCSCGYYDQILQNNTFIHHKFSSYKDLFNKGNKASSTGITFSIYTIGQMAGALFASSICDRWGRCVTILCGTAIIASSHANSQFLAGRFILGVGIAIAIVGAPTYCIEISPPQWRGRMTALYNTYGYVIFSTDPNNAIVRLEMEEFKANISLNGTDKRWWDYSALYKTRNARWRSLMVFMMGLFGQMSGNGLGYYNLQIYQSLGFDSRMQFAMNLIGTCSSAITAWVAVSLSDRMPRRKVLVYGTFACSLMLGVNAGLSAKWASCTSISIIIALYVFGRLAATFFFLFGVVYAFTYTPLQSLYPAECLETTARAKGISMKIFVINITSFINLYCIPIGLQNIQLVYVFWDFIEGILWHLFCVETVGRTLEELDEVFSARNPAKASQKKHKVQNYIYTSEITDPFVSV
ncbi:hypothetical protein M422DRAFT_165280, partial [Sphaerobolus stellatus SS14]